jgi:two-component system CheB/CheR fusion protein
MIPTNENLISLALARSATGLWTFDAERREIAPDRALRVLLALDPQGSDEEGAGLLRHIHSDDRERIAAALEAAHSNADRIEERLRFTRPDGATVLIEMIGERTPDDEQAGIVHGIMRDITAELRQGAELASLVREMDHRVRNLIALILSIIQAISAREGTSDAYRAALGKRLEALGRTYSLLSRTRWSGVELAALLREELGRFEQNGQVVLSGPRLSLPPDDAQPLAILLHELSSNAMTHGALSHPDGKVNVAWRRIGDLENRIELIWSERDGPETAEPTHEGFGLTVLERMIPAQLGAHVQTNWEKAGFSVTIRLTLGSEPDTVREVMAEIEDFSGVSRLDRSRLQGKKAIVVDDEWLLAEQHTHVLERAGVDVVGTFTRIEVALGFDASQIDFAVLDFAMRGATTLKLAEKLAGEGIPIIFVSGVDLQATLPASLASEIIVAKPAGEAVLLDAAAAAVAGRG